jgi:hypothetical protein
MQTSELNDSERAWLQAHLQVAHTFVQSYAPHLARPELTPEGLDAAWNAWIPTSAQEPEMANAIVNATGAAFGQFLVDTAGFRWVVASDEHGTEMAVIALEGKADVTVFPMNLVAKRYEAGEKSFIPPLIERIREQVSSIS